MITQELPLFLRPTPSERHAVRELLTDHGVCVDDWERWDAAMVDPDQRAQTRYERHAEREVAAKLCADCPVKALCLLTAVCEGERWGVRGGLPAWRVSQLTQSVSRGALQPLFSELDVINAPARAAQAAPALDFRQAVAA